MSDEFDLASDLEQAERDHLIAQARNKPKYIHNGRCCNCGEKSEARFCDKFCADDFEKMIQAKKRNGG
jgi:hypothetical protein